MKLKSKPNYEPYLMLYCEERDLKKEIMSWGDIKPTQGCNMRQRWLEVDLIGSTST